MRLELTARISKNLKILSDNHFLIIVGISFLFTTSLGCVKKNSLPDPFEAGWKNQAVCEVLQDDENLRVLKCIFPPGVGHEKHYHEPHFGYTITGSRFRIVDETGTRDVEVPTGTSFSKDKVTSHQVLNIGDSTAVFLIIEYK